MNTKAQELYANYKTTIKTYYFTVLHPETGERKIVMHPAVNLEMARKVLAIKCGEVILDRIISVKVGA